MENVNDVNEELIDASIDGDLEKVKECLKNGADVNVYSNVEWTPLLCATHFNHLEIAKLLIENGADVNAKETLQESWTPLIAATINEIEDNEVKKEIIKLLIDNGADVNAKDRHGFTPLMHTLYCNNNADIEIVKKLIDNGADINAKNKYEKTALDYAKNKEIISLLKSKMQIKPKIKAKAKQQAKSNNFEREV